MIKLILSSLHLLSWLSLLFYHLDDQKLHLINAYIYSKFPFKGPFVFTLQHGLLSLKEVQVLSFVQSLSKILRVVLLLRKFAFLLLPQHFHQVFLKLSQLEFHYFLILHSDDFVHEIHWSNFYHHMEDLNQNYLNFRLQTLRILKDYHLI